MKKTLAIILTMAMLLTLLAGCGGSASAPTEAPKENAPAAEVPKEEAPAAKDPVTLVWYYMGTGQQKDTGAVEAYANELVKQYPGLEHVSLVLKPYDGDEYKQALTLAQAAGDQIDIVCSVYLDPFGTLVDDGVYMPMDDYMSETLKNEFPEWLWALGSKGGKTYMVPNYQNAFNASTLVFPKEYMDKYGDYDAMTAVLSDPAASLTDKAACLEEYVMAVREGEGTSTKYAYPILQSLGGSLGYGFMTPYDTLGNNFIVTNGTNKVEYIYATDAVKEILAIHADWFDKGIFAPDGISTDNNDYNKAHMLEPVSYAYSLLEGVGNAEDLSQTYSGSNGFESVAIMTQGYNFVQNSWAAGGNGISATCENPEEAALFLECINCGSDIGIQLYNALIFGLEGTHYTRDASDPNRIETLEYTGSQGNISTSYAGFKWCLGNSFYAWKNQAVADGQYERIKKYNEDPTTQGSSIPGFVVDNSKVSTQVDQINAVFTEYEYTLLYGVTGKAGWEAKYQEFMDKLNAAGLQEVLAEYQSQLDAYLAAK